MDAVYLIIQLICLAVELIISFFNGFEQMDDFFNIWYTCLFS